MTCVSGLLIFLISVAVAKARATKLIHVATGMGLFLTISIILLRFLLYSARARIAFKGLKVDRIYDLYLKLKK